VQRKQVQVRREEILSATVRRIQQVGIDSLRIADVAGALEVSTGLVVYHFQTKENLVAAAFRHAAERDLLRMARIVAKHAPAPERLMEALRWYAPSGRARGWTLWIDGWSSAMRDPLLAQVISDLDEQWRRSVADLIAEGVAAGDFVTPDPMSAAVRITALLDGLAVKTLVHARGVRRDLVSDSLGRQLAWELGVDSSALSPQTD
jgi:AcrR family transcriptional regulator